MPEPTAGEKDCCSKKTKEGKAIRLTQLLNSNNARRPGGDIRSHSRLMKQHDLVMVKSVVTGDFATTPKYNLDSKSGQVSFASWWELDKDALKTMTNEQQLENAEDAVGENEANRGTKRTHITSAVITVSLGGVKTALANFISDGKAMFVCTTPSK